MLHIGARCQGAQVVTYVGLLPLSLLGIIEEIGAIYVVGFHFPTIVEMHTHHMALLR